MIKSIIIAVVAALTVAVCGLSYQVASKKDPAPQSPQAQKFRFDEQCPDGLRVGYVSSIRLPKSVICQQAVGE